MSKKNRKLVLSIILILAVVWAGFNIGPSQKKTPSPVLETVQPLQAGQTASVKHPSIDTLTLARQSWGANPFRYRGKRTNTAKGPARSWKVTGIIHRPEGAIAYINQRSVKVGELVDRAKVIRIDKREVILEFKGDRFTITLSRG